MILELQNKPLEDCTVQDNTQIGLMLRYSNRDKR